MINMRLAKPQDAEKLGKLYYDCWMDLYPNIVSEEDFIPISLESAVDDFKKNKCRDVIEAWIGDDLVGFCSFGNCRDGDSMPNTGEIYRLYILKDHQKSGTGRRLIHEAVRCLRREEYNQVVAWVLINNQDAVSFYEALGFVADGSIRNAKDSPLKEKRFFIHI